MSVLLVGILLTWRITSLLVSEDGPADLFARSRDRVGVYYDEDSECRGRWMLPSVLCCVWCSSVWVGWAVAFLLQYDDWLLHGLAFSTGAIMIDQWVKRHA